jgi:hypothetical protein
VNNGNKKTPGCFRPQGKFKLTTISNLFFIFFIIDSQNCGNHQCSFNSHDESSQAMIAALQEKDEEDHGKESTIITLAIRIQRLSTIPPGRSSCMCGLTVRNKYFEQLSHLLSTAPRQGSDTIFLVILSLNITLGEFLQNLSCVL